MNATGWTLTVQRFEKLWQKWDAAVNAGEPPQEIVRDLSDESLLELLAGAGSARRYERNILVTEALNRLVRARRAVTRTREFAETFLKELEGAADATAEIVHATEAVVESMKPLPSPEAKVAHAASAQTESMRGVMSAAEVTREQLTRLQENALKHARDRSLYEDGA